MILLVLVFHSALTYNTANNADIWDLKDPNSSSILTDFLVLLIHSFNMPVFFLIAGFFGSMLFYEKGFKQMIINRISRIVYPFVVFLFVLSPIIYYTFNYSKAVFEQKENPLEITTQLFKNSIVFFPQTTAHLWFLYYLVLITAVSVLLGLFLKNFKKLTNVIFIFYNWLSNRVLVYFLFLSSITFLILTIFETSLIRPSVSLMPNIKNFVFYFFFYIVGWISYKSKHHLETFKQYDWIFTILAVLLVLIQGLIIQFLGMDSDSNSRIMILFSSVIAWLFVFGIIGLFIRYGSKHSERMRYVSDASYWAYLIHLPITAIIPAFIWELPIHGIFKFLIVLLVTTFICVFSYHFLVRDTFIGIFLNGRKYPRKRI